MAKGVILTFSVRDSFYISGQSCSLPAMHNIRQEYGDVVVERRPRDPMDSMTGGSTRKICESFPRVKMVC